MAVYATSALAEFVSKVRYLPAPICEKAKVHIADTLACIYAGSASKAAALLTRVSVHQQDNGRIIVPGLGRWNDPSLAAMLSGVCAHADDFDDTSEYTMNGHPSAPIVSALIPTAFITHASGADVIRAYAVGIEVACKLGRAIGSAHTRQGWHTISTLGAAAAAANLRGLDAGRTEYALAIACSFAGGLLGNTGTMTKALHCGHAAQAGYLSAALAEQGFTAGLTILEAKAGFLDVLTNRSVGHIDLTGLGENWDLATPGLAVKLYPCCSCTHLAIDGAIALRRQHRLPPSEIQKVVCSVREECTHYLRFPHPRTAVEAKFSMNYTVAVALLYEKVTLEDFEPIALNRSDVAVLAPKVQTIIHPDDENARSIEVVLMDGRRFAIRKNVPRGSPQDPPSWNDIIGKLHSGITRAKASAPRQPEKLFASLRKMEHLPLFVELLQM